MGNYNDLVDVCKGIAFGSIPLSLEQMQSLDFLRMLDDQAGECIRQRQKDFQRYKDHVTNYPAGCKKTGCEHNKNEECLRILDIANKMSVESFDTLNGSTTVYFPNMPDSCPKKDYYKECQDE